MNAHPLVQKHAAAVVTVALSAAAAVASCAVARFQIAQHEERIGRTEAAAEGSRETRTIVDRHTRDIDRQAEQIVTALTRLEKIDVKTDFLVEEARRRADREGRASTK